MVCTVVKTCIFQLPNTVCIVLGLEFVNKYGLRTKLGLVHISQPNYTVCIVLRLVLVNQPTGFVL